MNGLDGVKDYLKFWNVVDWIAIGMGFTTVAFWLVFVLKVSGDLPLVFSNLPSDALDLAVFTNRSYLTEEARKGFGRKAFAHKLLNLVLC